MKAGRASRTAEMVCLGRALAHGVTEVAQYSDPTAEVLLPPEAKRRLSSLRQGDTGGPMLRAERFIRVRQADAMVARTVEIDTAIRSAKNPQLVILGAGLDGRAFRMGELSDTVVFEVDHPDSQRDKRERASTLTSQAKELRFVPVNFEKDDLEESLAKAGHDPKLPTTWVWEGVVMYLHPADVEATLRINHLRIATADRLP
jgi:methyltransferase (TIGR00027 family)